MVTTKQVEIAFIDIKDSNFINRIEYGTDICN